MTNQENSEQALSRDAQMRAIGIECVRAWFESLQLMEPDRRYTAEEIMAICERLAAQQVNFR